MENNSGDTVEQVAQTSVIFGCEILQTAMPGDQFVPHAAHDEQDEKVRINKKPCRGHQIIQKQRAGRDP